MTVLAILERHIYNGLVSWPVVLKRLFFLAILYSCTGSCAKGICGWVSIDTLNNCCWIDTSVDTQLILDRHLGWQLVKSWLIFADIPASVYQYIESIDTWPTIDWLLIECWSSCWLSVNQMLAKYPWRCRSVSLEMSVKGRSRVSTDTRPWTPLVLMIPLK